MRSLWMCGLGASFVLALSCGPVSTKETNCSDGQDDDGNGLIDCADYACNKLPVCAPLVVPGCTGGGTGAACNDQLSCLNGDSSKPYGVNPLSVCVCHKCAETQSISVKLTVDGREYAGSPNFDSMSNRIVSKTAVDGSKVSCDTLAQAAAGSSAADADQLAASKRFNLWAWDVVNLDVSPGESWVHSRIRTNVGKDFLLWIEIWTGPQVNGLPTGSRIGWTCVDGIPELKLEDDLDTGNARNIPVKLAKPQS